MKMNTKLKYLPIAAFAAVALSLAGCGGGGDDDPVTSMMPEPEAPVVDPEAPADTTQDLLTAADEALVEAMAAVDALEADEDATDAQIATAKAAVLTAQEAVDAAQTAHEAYLDTTDERILAAAAEAQERAEGLADAIVDAKAVEGVFADTNKFDPVNVTATHDGDAATVKLTAALKYAKQDTGPAPIDGWDGSRWSKDDTKSTEHVTVYSDINAPTPKSFDTANVRMLDDADTAEVTAGGVVAFTSASTFLKHAKATSLNPADEGAAVTHSGTAADGLTFEGTFGGAMGDFTCEEGAACTVTLNDKGVVTAIGEAWVLMPM